MSIYSGDFKTQVINAVLKDGMPIKQAVIFFNVSRNTVREWVRLEQGLIQPANKNKKISEGMKKEAVTKVLSGKSYYQVAKEYGVSHTSIHNWKKEQEKDSLETKIKELKTEIKKLKKNMV